MGARGVKAIRKDFTENSGSSFQIICFEWMSFLFPELQNAVALGEVDRNGIDLYSLNADDSYDKAIQCKGFKKKFGDSQIKQCIKSITSFIEKKQKCGEYLLIINNEVAVKEYRDKLDTELKKITDAKLADSATYLTTSSFINYYSKQFQKYILDEISKSNSRFYAKYNSVMEQKFYLEDVPFLAEKNGMNAPLKFLWKLCANTVGNISNQDVLDRIQSKFTFIISEFGFGKTTLLFQFFKHLFDKKHIPVYLPISSFRGSAFTGTSNMAKEVFRIITQSDLEPNDKFLKFSAEAMTTLLRTNPGIVLMLDGLDEHSSLYNHNALQVLFESTESFVTPVIFAFRKSFWEERRSDFEVSLTRPTRKNIQHKLFLTEWDENTINNYIDLFQKKNEKNYQKAQLDRLTELNRLIANKQYSVYYGDIPKRPLFLEMIVRDVLSGDIQQRNIGELYLGYFSEKFKRDLQGQIGGVHPQRQLPDMSIDATEVALIDIHEQIAKYCYQIDPIEKTTVIVENIVDEKDVAPLLKFHGLPTDIGAFLSLSVLVPISRRNSGSMKMKFVHNSFMEFFIAKSIFDDIIKLDDIQLIDHLKLSFPDAIMNFFASIVATAGRNDAKTIAKIASKTSSIDTSPLIEIIRKESSTLLLK